MRTKEVEVDELKFTIKRFSFSEKSMIENESTMITMNRGVPEPSIDMHKLKILTVHKGLSKWGEFDIEFVEGGAEIKQRFDGTKKHIELLDFAIGDSLFKEISDFNHPDKKKYLEDSTPSD